MVIVLIAIAVLLAGIGVLLWFMLQSAWRRERYLKVLAQCATKKKDPLKLVERITPGWGGADW